MAWSAISGILDMSWSQVSIDTAMTSQNGYVANGVGAITFTLPTSSAIGDEIEIIGKGAGGWDIEQGAGQTIHWGTTSSTTGAGGSVASTIQYQCIVLRCITADTDWEVVTANGTLTFV